MRRRRLLTGIGALAVGGSLVTATGAFTGVDTDRRVAVTVAADGEAFLHLSPLASDDGFPAARSDSDGRLTISIPGAGDLAAGVGTDGVYRFDDLLRVSNHGTRPVDVYSTYGGAALADLALYEGDERVRLDGPSRTVELGVGESFDAGLYVDTRGSTTGRFEETLTLVAEGVA